MLKTLPRCLGPELTRVLSELQPRQEIVLADAFFPGGKGINCQVIDGTGRTLVELAAAISQVLSLSSKNGGSPLYMMAPVELDGGPDPKWKRSVMEDYQAATNVLAEPFLVERFKFYDRAQMAVAVVKTTDQVVYGNLGIIKPEFPSRGIPAGIPAKLVEILYRLGHGEAVMIVGSQFSGYYAPMFNSDLNIEEMLRVLQSLWEPDPYAVDAVAVASRENPLGIRKIIYSHPAWKELDLCLIPHQRMWEKLGDWRTNALVLTRDDNDTAVLVRKGLTKGL